MNEGVSIDKNKNRVLGILKTGSRVSNWIVISVGGSLIVPNDINTIFISNFKKVILKQISCGKRFIIVCGGGAIARDYQNAHKRIIRKADDIVLDWIGINATRFNAEFMASVFGDMTYEGIISDPNEGIMTKKPIVFAAGGKPGCSTDYVSVLLAENVGAQRIINLTNTDGVYNTDPNVKNGKKAKMFRNISWNNYLAMIPKKWTPGLSSPFDPVASKKAKRIGLEVVVVNGNNLINLETCLSSCGFKGTTINNLGYVPNLYPYVYKRKNRRARKAGDLDIY